MGGLKVEDFDELWIRDRHGKRVQIMPLAANARRRFRRLHTFALKRIQDSPDPLDALYDKDDVFREVTDEALGLFELHPEDFDLGRIVPSSTPERPLQKQENPRPLMGFWSRWSFHRPSLAIR